ncbi:MAG: glycoside hydrolase family 9 protein, partial [Chloroflexota bacterium]
RNYVTLTEDWQSVRIPLSAFIYGTEFVPTQTSGINFGSSADATGTFWLNNIRFTSPDSEPAIPAIKINLIGYQPDAPKYALITGPNLTFPKDTPFSITPANSDEEIHSGVLNGITDFDPASGDSIYIANFDELTEQGLYRLHIEGLETSPVFRIGTNIYDNLLVDTMRYFYMQRQGIELDFQTAGAFERGIGHPLDTVAEFASGAFPARDVSGGWYDAGDYGKYVNAGAAAISDLLWAYRLFPDAFQDNQFNIPESGNGVPDLLDEVRWELEWLLKMQDPNEGGFWTRVGPTEFGQPDESTHTRTIEDTDGERVNVQPTGNTASAVAALAMAAPFYREIDPLFADELIAAAELGWQYLENHPETVLSIPGAYADDEDTQERLWAAAALYATTNSESAHAYYLANYQNFAQLWQSETDNAYGIVIMGMVAFLEYGFSENPDPEALAWFTQQYGTWRTMMLERAEAPWRTTLLDEDYYWGSNSAAISTVNTLYIADLITQQDTANTITIAHQTLNYILGINPLRLSYISGYGVDSIERPHSALWSSDDIVPIPAGVLVGGPNEYTNPFLYSAFPAKRFSDSDHNWSTNEHTIYWNAQLVFM